MTGNSFAYDIPGRGARKHRRDHRRAAALAFARAKGKGKGHHGPPDPEQLEELIAMRHMRGGRFGGGPGGGRGRGRARRGDVRLALLRLLAEEPRNGYQLMQEIEARSDGRWRPSPGSVYPTLSQLEDEALIRSAELEGQRRFEITDAGREHLQTRAEESAPWEDSAEGGTSMRDVRHLVGGLAAAAMQVASVGTDAQRARAAETLAEARRALYAILAEDAGDGPQA